MHASSLLLCPVCNTGTGAAVRAGIVNGLVPLAAMGIVLILLTVFATWIHHRAPVAAVARGRATPPSRARSRH